MPMALAMMAPILLASEEAGGTEIAWLMLGLLALLMTVWGSPEEGTPVAGSPSSGVPLT